jgi:hypothetical protein
MTVIPDADILEPICTKEYPASAAPSPDALSREPLYRSLVVQCLEVLLALALSPVAGLIGAGAYERVVAAQQRHPASHHVQGFACIALAHIIGNDERCGEDLLSLWAHHGVLDALLHTHALNAAVVKVAFLVLRNIAISRHNTIALDKAAVYKHIFLDFHNTGSEPLPIKTQAQVLS